MIILGELVNNADMRLDGWCWAAEQPTERRIVEIYVNGRQASSAVAARMHPEARERGIGDGYHGFSVPMPGLPDGDEIVIIEARDRQTGTIFGRVVIQYETDSSHTRKKLAEAETSMKDMLHRLALHQAETTNNISFTTALGRLGASLLARAPVAGGAVPMEQTILPWIPKPQFSLILPAHPAWAQTCAALRGLSALLAAHETEIILADDGADPETALACARVRNLGYVFQPGEATSRLDAAARSARGERLCILSGEISGARDVLSALSTLPRAGLVLGQHPAALARALGYAPWPAATPMQVAESFHAVMDKKLFTEAGGFEAHLAPGLAFVDFALKSSLLGCQPVLWQARDTAPELPSYRQRMAFQERWPGAEV